MWLQNNRQFHPEVKFLPQCTNIKFQGYLCPISMLLGYRHHVQNLVQQLKLGEGVEREIYGYLVLSCLALFSFSTTFRGKYKNSAL